MSDFEWYKKRLTKDGVRVLARSDVNTAAVWCVTLPSELKSASEGLQRAFFQVSYNFMVARYSEENVISAWVHNDETTPHLHFLFIPICTDAKRGGFKLSAKERLDKKELLTFHKDFQSHIDANFNAATGFEAKVYTSKTAAEGLRTIPTAQFKRETVQELERLREENERLRKEVERLRPRDREKEVFTYDR
jgi:hypothetical protein